MVAIVTAGMFAWQYATEAMARRAFVAVRDRFVGRYGHGLAAWRFVDPTKGSHVLVVYVDAPTEHELRLIHRRLSRCWQVDSGATYNLVQAEVSMFLNRRAMELTRLVESGQVDPDTGRVTMLAEGLNGGAGLFMHRDGDLSVFPEPSGSG